MFICKPIFFALLFASVGISLQSCTEKTRDEAANKVSEMQKDAKQGMREVKKEVRDATGNQSIIEDVKDNIEDAGDELEHQGDKAKRAVD